MKYNKVVYALLLYVLLVIVEVIIRIIDVNFNYSILLFDWLEVLLVILFSTLIDFIFVYFIGLIIDVLLRKKFKKTIIPNIVLTILIYEIIKHILLPYILST